MRSTDLVTFWTGADWPQAMVRGAGNNTRRTAAGQYHRRSHALELIPHPQACDLILTYTALVAEQLKVSLEYHVIQWLIGETYGGDPACERIIHRNAGRYSGVGVVILVPDECVQLLCRGRGKRGEDVVCSLHVSTCDAATNLTAINGVDFLCIGNADIREHPAEHEGTDIVASIGRQHRHCVAEGARTQCWILICTPPVPEGAADSNARPSPLE